MCSQSWCASKKHLLPGTSSEGTEEIISGWNEEQNAVAKLKDIVNVKLFSGR